MLVTQALIQTIEEAIATERSTFASGMARLLPASGAGWLSVAGGRAIFTGADFFGNRAMGLGLHGPVQASDLDRVEAFYTERGLPAALELAALADRSLIRLLRQRGYGLVRFRNIYAQPVGPGSAPALARATPPAGLELQTVGAANAALWSLTLLDGFEYTCETDRARVTCWNQMLHSLPEVTSLVALLDGQAVGAASVMFLDSIALLGGAATLPAYRRRGIQRALIAARLTLAARTGCALAIVTADPGSSSGRNAERSGFQLLGNHVDMQAPDGAR
ncbi:MAG: GNAT family N-acetyltransferase [Candidatus Tectimicrobiota bacterium]